MENEIIYIKNINEKHLKLVGNKAYNLSKLNGNFNVPEGFVITTIFLNKYFNIKKYIKQLSNLNYDNYSSVNELYKEIERNILNINFTKKDKEKIINSVKKLNLKSLAIRSSSCSEDSSQNSFAGQFDSFLDVCIDNLMLKIKECFASFFSTRSLYYRNLKGINISELDMAVIVQDKINSNIAGVIFYSNKLIPITGSKFILEFIDGLGDKLVSGEKTPTKITINSINEINKLNMNIDIVKLYNITKKIKIIIDFEPDIEFCIQNNQIYILQVRPISF